MIALHQAEIADIQRNKTIKGALGWNMVLACEAEIKHRAGQGNDLAISGRNALNKISRSKDNKGAKSKKKGSKKDVSV